MKLNNLIPAIMREFYGIAAIIEKPYQPSVKVAKLVPVAHKKYLNHSHF